MGIIENIVDRCHVSESFDEVLLTVISKLEDGHKSWDAMSPRQQSQFKLVVARKHAANQRIYNFVMKGLK